MGTDAQGKLLERIFSRNFLLGEDTLQAARGYRGNLVRLRGALQKLLNGLAHFDPHSMVHPSHSRGFTVGPTSCNPGPPKQMLS